MALDQAKAKILAKDIEMELEKKLVFAPFCNRKYEKELKKAGDQIDILQVGRPTITTTTDGLPVTISAFEEIQSSKVSMPVRQQSWFAPVFHDVDAAQAVAGVLTEITTGGAYGLADAMDSHIATIASAGVKDAAAAYKVEATTILGFIDSAMAKLYDNNVPFNEEIELVVTPRAYMLIKQNLIGADTNNSDLIKRGVASMYGNVAIRVSNNIVKANAGAEDLCIMRTRRAIAFVEQINQIKTGEVEKGFGTYVKGLALYQAQLVQPKELIVLNWKYA